MLEMSCPRAAQPVHCTILATDQSSSRRTFDLGHCISLHFLLPLALSTDLEVPLHDHDEPQGNDDSCDPLNPEIDGENSARSPPATATASRLPLVEVDKSKVCSLR